MRGAGGYGRVGEPSVARAIPMGDESPSRESSWILTFGFLFAAIPGIAIAAAAFAAFQRIYRFVPVTDVFVVALFGIVLSGILVRAARAKQRYDDPMLLSLALATGLALSLYTMGGWELSSAAFLFTVACLASYFGVTRSAAAAGWKKLRWSLVSAFVALGLGLLPSVLVVDGFWTATVYLPQLIRDVGMASVLGVATSATFLGLATSWLPTPLTTPTTQHS